MLVDIVNKEQYLLVVEMVECAGCPVVPLVVTDSVFVTVDGATEGLSGSVVCIVAELMDLLLSGVAVKAGVGDWGAVVVAAAAAVEVVVAVVGGAVVWPCVELGTVVVNAVAEAGVIVPTMVVGVLVVGCASAVGFELEAELVEGSCASIGLAVPWEQTL